MDVYDWKFQQIGIFCVKKKKKKTLYKHFSRSFLAYNEHFLNC